MAWANRLDPPPIIVRMRKLGIRWRGRRRHRVIVDMSQTLATKIALALPYECAAGHCLHDKVWEC